MINFTPTGDLLTDLQMCITNNNAMRILYQDKKGNVSDRIIAPLEIRNDGVYAWSLEKEGSADTGLRFFLLRSLAEHEVVDRQFDPNNFKTIPIQTGVDTSTPAEDNFLMTGNF